MIAWINITILLVVTVLFLLFYVRSARPAGREMINGPGAYQLCFYERMVSAIFEFTIISFPLFIVLCYVEGQDLLLRYGEAYAEYCRKTGAFWPKRFMSIHGRKV